MQLPRRRYGMNTSTDMDTTSGRSTRCRATAWRWLALLTFVLASAPALAAQTYYIRIDGGGHAQCNGRVDVPASKAASKRACAWRSPFDALPVGGPARIAGGDTLVIGPGEYMIGDGAQGANDDPERCNKDWPWDCFLTALPSGPSAALPTRILGSGHDAGCENAPVLWGTERVSKVLNLEGSSNVEVGCLEITDHADCVEFHVDTAIRCERDNAPYGQWGQVGISARKSNNVWLHDLDIHGLGGRGILAGGLSDWTVERVKITANGWAGWDGDVGDGSANSGRIIMRHVAITWNGCAQHWQTGKITGCWAQEGGGYGDGLGTARTGGQWLIEDSLIAHNTSDGIDLLYLDGAADTSATIRRVRAEGNAGNQIKTRGNALIEDSVVIGNCAYFEKRGAMQSADSCRALGNAISLALVDGQTTTVRHNTITGQGDCLIISNGGNSASRVHVTDNALLGQPDWRANLQGNAGELTCGHYADDSPVVPRFRDNVFWKVKPAPCPSGGNVCSRNPMLADMDMAHFDPTPLAGSPLIGRAAASGEASIDFNGSPRPPGRARDVGAVNSKIAN